MAETSWKYEIHHPGEYAAGIRGFEDSITVTVHSGDPGGDEGEFAKFIMDCLKEWYDGAGVSEPEKSVSFKKPFDHWKG